MNPDSPPDAPADAPDDVPGTPPDAAPAPPSEGKPRLRQRFREQAREELIEAALLVFQREGVKEARIDAIAAEAGVSVGTIYNLFGDRNGLVAAVLERGRAELFGRVRVYLEGSLERPFEERLHTVVHTLVDRMREHWQTLRLIADAHGAPTCHAGPTRPPPTVIREIHGLMSALVRHGVETGALAPIDVHVATCALMGTIRNTIDIDLILGLDAPSEDRADAIIQLFLHGTVRR